MDRLEWLGTYVIVASLAVAGPWGHHVRAAPSPVLLAQVADDAVGAPEAGLEGGQNAEPPAVRRDYSYDPSGRRDPFSPLIQRGENGAKADVNLPPLQRVGLTEINLIGIIWGGFGYTAMVQTPDGKGYAVRRGTRIGPNNGMVTKITENSVMVIERYTDIYGKEQEREYVKLLHPSEESE